MTTLKYTYNQMPTTTQTVMPSETITTPLQWFNEHYTNQEGLAELEEDPTMKDIIYEDAFTALLSVGWYDNENHKWGIAGDDACTHYGMVDDLLIDENVATIQGCSDFVRVWELNTLPKLLKNKELLTANVSYALKRLLSWKQQGVYLPQIILDMMKECIVGIKNREIYQEYLSWYTAN